MITAVAIGGKIATKLVMTGSKHETKLVTTGGKIGTKLVVIGENIETKLVATGAKIAMKLVATGTNIETSEFDGTETATGTMVIALTTTMITLSARLTT
jgi:hypothetical protein